MVAFLHRRSSSSCLVSRLLFKPTPRRATLACADRSDGDVRATQMRVMCAWVAGGSRRRSRAGVHCSLFFSNCFRSTGDSSLLSILPLPPPRAGGARAHERAYDARRARCGDVTCGIAVHAARGESARARALCESAASTLARARALYESAASALARARARARVRVRPGWAPRRARLGGAGRKGVFALRVWCLAFLVRVMKPVRR